jgi:hypothetical protein
MSEALFPSSYSETVSRRLASLAVVAALFLASYLLAISIQQAVTLITAKQLGGYSVTVQIGQGRLIQRTSLRGRRVEFRSRWWARPDYEWLSGMTPESAMLARLAGLAMNLVLAALGMLDLRHRRSRGLFITVLAHAAAALTALAWGIA